MEMTEYENEGIMAEALTFTDNQSLLVGIFAVRMFKIKFLFLFRNFLWLNH